MRRIHKRQRPDTARELGDGLKLHVRELSIGRRTYRLLTLRPGTDAAFSTNLFHDTWHLLSDLEGAHLLARLFWGLSYQWQPGTVLAIHGEHLHPTPFDADPSHPILLMPAGINRFDRDELRRIKDLLPRLPPPSRTVRWRTHGLDRALEDPQRFRKENDLEYWWGSRYAASEWTRERTDLCGGFVCYTAPPRVLREQAVSLHRMRYWEWLSGASDYHYLAERKRGPHADGEVQIFRDYRRRLSVARVARREVLAESDRPLPPEPLREAVHHQCEVVSTRARRHPQ